MLAHGPRLVLPQHDRCGVGHGSRAKLDVQRIPSVILDDQVNAVGVRWPDLYVSRADGYRTAGARR